MQGSVVELRQWQHTHSVRSCLGLVSTCGDQCFIKFLTDCRSFFNDHLPNLINVDSIDLIEMELLVIFELYLNSLDARSRYTDCANFPTPPEVGIPSARYVNARARSRYTDGTVYQRQSPEVGIQTLFSNAYWPRHARVIEIQTRQQMKNNSFHETQRIFMNKF